MRGMFGQLSSQPYRAFPGFAWHLIVEELQPAVTMIGWPAVTTTVCSKAQLFRQDEPEREQTTKDVLKPAPERVRAPDQHIDDGHSTIMEEQLNPTLRRIAR
jgi:hypothetical protein